MAKQPGPRQIFQSVINRISFPSVGGLLFIRVNQNWEGTVLGPDNVAAVTFPLLPWDSFDLFRADDVKDPTDKTQDFAIQDPVTSGMLAHWLYWRPKNPVKGVTTEILPGLTVWFIDLAEWYGVYNHMDSGQAAYGLHDDKEQEMYDGLNAAFPGIVRENFGARLADHLESVNGVPKFVDTPGPPTAKFFEVAAAAEPPWTYHSEPGPPYTTHRSDATAVLIINLAKAYRDIPDEPGGGKKPPGFDMRIDLPESMNGGLLTWTVEASADSTKISTPPKPSEDGRRTFPLADKTTLGPPAKVEHLVPQWSPFPTASGSGKDPKAGSHVLVHVTFGTAKEKPTVDIEKFIEEGGTIG